VADTSGTASAIAACRAAGAITAIRPSRGASATRAATVVASSAGSTVTSHGSTPVERTERGGSNAGSLLRRTSAARAMISAGVR
jgi:hypothetical protein